MVVSRIPRRRLSAGLFFLAGAAGLWAEGVTLITHGFNGNVDDWVIPMAGKMAEYTGYSPDEATCYVLLVTSNSGPATAEWQNGVKPNLSASGEIFIKLDWSARAGLFQASTQQIAGVAVAALTNPALVEDDTGGRALAELPLHLIGHSRGGSVVTEMARILGQQGIWVNQVTTLDPVPLGFPNNDAAVRNWQNVLYADNYWQDSDSNPLLHSDPLAGAYNRKLTSFAGGNSSDHSDVHLWYHGTVDLDTPSTTAEADITAAMRSSWWTGAEEEGAEAGFRFTRLGGGDWLSAFQPAGADRVVEGFNGIWDLGAGMVGNRSMLSSNSGAWPNVIRCLRNGSGPVAEGRDIDLDLYYQAGASEAGELEVTVLFDVDRNPWNGNGVVIDAGGLAKTGTTAVNFSTVSIDPGMTNPGLYFVGVRLTDGTKSRVLYATETVEVVEAMPPKIDGATVRKEGGLMTFTVLGTPGETVLVQATELFDGWTTVATQELVGSSWEFSDMDTGDYPKRFYRVMLVPGR